MPLGPDSDPQAVLPRSTLEAVRGLRHVIAENARTARRMLVRIPMAVPIQAVSFTELNEHTPRSAIESLLAPLLAGEDAGLVSEAGCPAIADPGALLVAAAHAADIRVIPLVGPSSILLALMASGLNGQAFSFHGYLPVEPSARTSKLAELEAASATAGTAQLFIETPYRNEALFAAILAGAKPSTRLTVAADLTLAAESIQSRSIADWRLRPRPALASRPAIFAIQAQTAPSGRVSKPARRS